MRSLLLLLPLLVPLSADAGTIPLASFEWSQQHEITLPAQYSATLRMFNGPMTTAGWQETISSWPHESLAPQSIVDGFNAAIYSADNGAFVFYNGGNQGAQASNGGICGWCQLHWMIGDGADQFEQEKAESGWNVAMFVPRLGSHLEGYLVTRIERTVTADSQTIELHGIPIPEPASWLLVLCGCVLHFNKRSAP
jgi:hypothetical protein